MRWLVMAAFAGLAGCGGEPPEVSQTAQNGAAPSSAMVPVDQAEARCEKRPDFVVLRPDARIESCTSGKGPSPRRESGTIIYTTADKASAVTAWYREQAKAFGLDDALVAETPSPLYSAKDGKRRNFMVLTEPSGVNTRVTLNWGRDE